MKGQFELYIKKLLARADAADALARISSKNDLGIYTAVDSILLENELEALFAPPTHSTMEKRQKVLQKLSRLESDLIIKGVEDSNSDMIVVRLCQRYINEGYGLTDDIVDVLNKIYNSYGK